MSVIEVHCDGSSNGRSSSPCGWAYILILDGQLKGCGFGYIPGATNNIAEITGALEGLKHAQSIGYDRAILVSDSQYTLGMAGRTMNPTKNLSLVKELWDVVDKMQIVTRWVPGHGDGETADSKINHWADKLAKAGKDTVDL